jgi:hypothetical protein
MADTQDTNRIRGVGYCLRDINKNRRRIKNKQWQ